MSVCLCCGESLKGTERPVEDALTRHAFGLLDCPRCKSAVTRPVPADLGPYYPPVYYGGRHGFTHDYCLKRRLRWAFSKGAPQTLIDVGCGDGSFLLAAAERGAKVRGVEYSPETARSRGLDVVQSLDQIAIDEPADRITFWHSLEHFLDPLEALTQARERLAAEGLVLIAVPWAKSLQARVSGRSWLHYDVPRHLHHFSEAGLRALISRAGLEMVWVRRQEFEYDLLGWSQSLCTRLFGPPRVFMDRLMGRKPETSAMRGLAECTLGIALTGLFLPITLAEGLLNRGGTLVMAARIASPNR